MAKQTHLLVHIHDAHTVDVACGRIGIELSLPGGA